jgi:hypothetical protein
MALREIRRAVEQLSRREEDEVTAVLAAFLQTSGLWPLASGLSLQYSAYAVFATNPMQTAKKYQLSAKKVETPPPPRTK